MRNVVDEIRRSSKKAKLKELRRKRYVSKLEGIKPLPTERYKKVSRR